MNIYSKEKINEFALKAADILIDKNDELSPFVAQVVADKEKYNQIVDSFIEWRNMTTRHYETFSEEKSVIVYFKVQFCRYANWKQTLSTYKRTWEMI